MHLTGPLLVSFKEGKSVGPAASICNKVFASPTLLCAGLTSRPAISHRHRHSTEAGNPYSMGAQAHLLLDFCSQLGLEHVIFVAHADGCLLALRAASLAARCVLRSFLLLPFNRSHPALFLCCCSIPRSPSIALRPALSLHQELRFPTGIQQTLVSGTSTPRLYQACAPDVASSLAATASTPCPFAAELMAADGSASNNASESGRSSSAESSHAACVVAVVNNISGGGGSGMQAAGGTLAGHAAASKGPAGITGSGGILVPGVIGDAYSAGDVSSSDTGDGSSCSGVSSRASINDGARHRRSQSMPGPTFSGYVKHTETYRALCCVFAC